MNSPDRKVTMGGYVAITIAALSIPYLIAAVWYTWAAHR